MSEAPAAPRYEPISVGDQSTVVAEFVPDGSRETAYQSEAELEAAFIELLQSQAYEYLRDPERVRAGRQPAHAARGAERDRVQRRRVAAVLRREDRGRQRGNRREDGADPGGPRPGARARRRDVQERPADRQAEHPQQPAAGDQPVRGRRRRRRARATRYDVTILVNGLPLVHVELKRRGVAIREAFNQINRYQRDSFWSGSGLFEYVQLFVISNGTHTKYYSNTTRDSHVAEQAGGRSRRKTSNSFEFTSWWADARQQGDRRPDRLHEDVLRQAHAAQHPHPVLRLRRRPQAARDAAVPDRGDGADPPADRDLDQPPPARHDRGRRLRLAHHRLGQDADELQGRPAREPAARRRQGRLRRRPQGPRLPDHARVRAVREGRRQLERLDERAQAAARGPGRADHHHDDPEARPLRRPEQGPRDLRRPRRADLRRVPSQPVRRHARRDREGVQALPPVRLHRHADLRRERRHLWQSPAPHHRAGVRRPAAHVHDRRRDQRPERAAVPARLRQHDQAAGPSRRQAGLRDRHRAGAARARADRPGRRATSASTSTRRPSAASPTPSRASGSRASTRCSPPPRSTPRSATTPSSRGSRPSCRRRSGSRSGSSTATP